MTLGRLTRMTVGYVAASSVAAVTIVSVLLIVSASQSQLALDVELIGNTTPLIGLVACFVAILGLVPFLIAEAFAIRRSINTAAWYMGAGAVAGLIGLVSNLLLTGPRGGIRLSDLSEPVVATLTNVATISALAGACAGYTYWLIAVRGDRTRLEKSSSSAAKPKA